LLAVDPVADLLGDDPSPDRARALAAAHPSSSLAWATLAEQALDDARDVEGYAYARVGYHRGLDHLRKSGWRGSGPVPWAHEPNRGFLRALASLATAAERLGEAGEPERCRTFLRDCDQEAARALGL
jgi:hypothetical protein